MRLRRRHWGHRPSRRIATRTRLHTVSADRRHAHAVELVAEGVPVNVISRQPGHANSSVTARYLDHVAPASVSETMRRRTGSEPGPAPRARTSGQQ
ncbi:MAG TPA: hypothetical protein DHU96_04790 [Actinobacteria bacterium]|nr:hypothetical protein [Actinomycetota bacterium]